MVSTRGATLQRRRMLIQGIVQGVGFRPFVYTQAHRWALAGFVLNDSSGVIVEVEGEAEALDAFQQALREETPPLARVEKLTIEQIAPRGESTFSIASSSASSEHHALISPDTAICDDCLRELFNPTNRRYAYPFINCTNCGPRFTIIQDMPYDRARTTMRGFSLCSACQEEYENPLDRRFHAQPDACAACGPQAQIALWQKGESPFASSDQSAGVTDPLSQAARALAEGAILAVKGLGGYHLACNALDRSAVQRLRQRKQRDARPFALMVPDLATAHHLCQISGPEAALLTSRQRPIVLLARRSTCPVAEEVAPACDTLGIMLPYTPLHHLLLSSYARALAPHGLAALVMTSGNLSNEPIVYQDERAWDQFRHLADGIVTFNREIQTRCDDSVQRIICGGAQILRRSRGYVPEPLELPLETPLPLLACGGHLKNTFCFGKGRQAFLSQHIGDLENLETLASFRAGIEHFQRLFAFRPEIIAYDLHPAYLATQYALLTEIPRKIGIQHHHAHIASVIAEHALTGPVIGIAADGTGYGLDGAIWGCEIMRADLNAFQRLAHLAYVPLPGGEQAVRQPWRMAAVYLQRAYGDAFLDLSIPFVQQLSRAKWRILAQMIAKGLNSPPTSSLGRLFDAVAALLGLPAHAASRAPQYTVNQSYEGQAASELEQRAHDASDEEESYPFLLSDQTPVQIDVAPMLRAIVNDIQQGQPVAQIARKFHCSIAALLTEVCIQTRTHTGLNTVALSGGVFQNRLLVEQLLARLERNAFRVYLNRRVPPNDAGLSFGQAAIAAAHAQRYANTSGSLKDERAPGD